MVDLHYPFTEEEFRLANVAWGCNCGPSALAFVLQKPLEEARRAIPHFEERGYTSPSMMKAALQKLKIAFQSVPCPDTSCSEYLPLMFGERPALVRIQFTGPWTRPGAHPKAAYRHTHWIVAWDRARGDWRIFDCNGGIQSAELWEFEILKRHLIPPRGDGGWYPTHIWRTA
jgi:hypothetical protein